MPERPGDMDERDVDARFASIVAGWEGPVPGAGADEVDETSDAGIRAAPAEPGQPIPNGTRHFYDAPNCPSR